MRFPTIVLFWLFTLYTLTPGINRLAILCCPFPTYNINILSIDIDTSTNSRSITNGIFIDEQSKIKLFFLIRNYLFPFFLFLFLFAYFPLFTYFLFFFSTLITTGTLAFFFLYFRFTGTTLKPSGTSG